MADDVLDEAHAKGFINVVTIRPRGLIGPGNSTSLVHSSQFLVGDTTIIPKVISRLKAKKLPIIGDENNLVDFTFIDNAVDALLLAASSGAHTFGRYLARPF
jgi:nucleoside-diphosphate-sugar epimerase